MGGKTHDGSVSGYSPYQRLSEMSVVTDLSIPGSELAFGETLSDVPDVRVSLDRIVPVKGESFPYVWAHTSDQDGFREALRNAASVETFQLVHREDRKGLYSIDWHGETGPFLACLAQVGSVVLQGRGTAKRWEFTLRFDTHEDVNRFQELCSKREISFSIDRVVSGSAGTEPDMTLSQCQRETVELALKRGYFDVPRRTTMVNLAEELDISDQAVSARIRRAMKKLGQREFSEPIDHGGTRSQVSRT